jgi:uncharacterized protein YjbI with pentapeptide repeats
MAKEDHLSVLLQGREPWNEWRDANPQVKPDLRRADLHEAELSQMNLSRAVLIDADLHHACLKEANLAGANLRRANLRETDFQSADLHGAILAKADLRDANLKEADVRDADLREACLTGAVLEGADLKGAVLHEEGFRYVAVHNDKARAAHPAASSTRAAAVSTANAATATSSSGEPARTGAKRLSLKLGLAGAGLVVALGVGGLLVSRSSDRRDARVSEAVSTAVGASSAVDSVTVEGEALILRSGRPKVESGMYLGLLKTACQALGKMEETSGLREIRITNQSGEEGWIYGAPEKCGEILSKPAALTGLSIAAYTQPIRRQ